MKALLLVPSFTFLILVSTARAQIQQSWVAHYNNGITNGQHQALKMALDTTANIYICGFSQNTNEGTGYATIKYSPNGNQLWAARFDSTNFPQASPTGFAVDVSNDVVVTGNAGTVKWGANGNQLWSNSYAGLAIATDTNASVFITGFGTNFDTAKLASTGTNIWIKKYADVGPTVGQSILVDSSGNTYVSGLDVYYQERSYYEQCLLVVKYAPNGGVLWLYQDNLGGSFYFVFYVSASKVDALGSLFVLFDANNGEVYSVDKIDVYGNPSWQARGLTWGAGDSVSRGLALGRNNQTICTGVQSVYPYDSCYGTYGLSSNGLRMWSNAYPSLTTTSTNGGEAITADNGGISYVTGYSPDANGTNNIVTIAYDPNGKQLWLQRYTGLGYGAVGYAIAVDNNGNVYVAGYENVPGGGTEMVLIKYAPVTLQHQTNGNFMLQAQGAAGEPFDIRATTNLQTWLDLGTNNADTNGLLQYLDTNAPLYPWRFYLAIPE